MPLDWYTRIARDREQRRLFLRRIECGDHERIAAAHVIIAGIDAHDHDVGDVARDRLAGLVDGRMAPPLLQAKIYPQPHEKQHQKHSHGPPKILKTAPLFALFPHFAKTPIYIENTER